MKLWQLAMRGGDPRKIVPNLPDIIKEEWKDELMIVFNMAKTRGSYGSIPDAMFKEFAKNLTQPTPDVGYANKSYVKKYPDTYKKTGELYSKMKSDSPYEEIGKGRKIGLRIKIPLKTGDVPPAKAKTYQYLEEKRSFVKAAFLRAWPKILERLIEEIE